MPTPQIQVHGVHPLPLSDAVIADALDTWYGDRQPTEGPDRQAAITHIRQELTPTVLLDLECRNVDQRWDLSAFGQPGSDQAAWLEVFVDIKSGLVLGRSFHTPTQPDFRLFFWLHLFDPSKPLNTCYGQVTLPAITPLPAGLWELAPFEVVD